MTHAPTPSSWPSEAFASALKAISEQSAPAVSEASWPVVVKQVRPECAPDFEIPLRLADRGQLRTLAADHGGRLPAKFGYRRRCAVCGREHLFAVKLSADEVKLLRHHLKNGTGEDESATMPPQATLVREAELRMVQREPELAAPQILNLSETPLARANRLRSKAKLETNDDKAIAALKEAIELYDSLPHRDSAAAQARLALAERLVDREPDQALELIKLALPVLTGPSMRQPRERARELEKRLAA